MVIVVSSTNTLGGTSTFITLSLVISTFVPAINLFCLSFKAIFTSSFLAKLSNNAGSTISTSCSSWDILVGILGLPVKSLYLLDVATGAKSDVLALVCKSFCILVISFWVA